MNTYSKDKLSQTIRYNASCTCPKCGCSSPATCEKCNMCSKCCQCGEK